jgi:peptidoglycan/xylan/chitin deacetylase (PgdA/CDA1 family)
MMRFNIITAVFIVLLIALIGVHFFYGFSYYVFAAPVVLYVFALVYGSYNVQSNFYVKTISSAKTADKQIAISFDDGPAKNYTPQILQILKEHKVKAAFFCIGKHIKENESLLKQVYEEGHLIGNHSYSHDLWFDLFSSQKMYEDLQMMNSITEKTIGKKPKLFRPPYGVTNPNLKKAIKQGNYITIGWNIRSMDTVIKDAQKLLTKVTASLKPGAVVLFHDTSKITLDILSTFIKQAKDMGYDIVRLDKLLNLEPYA